VSRATAVAHPNIAFVKYWGHADAGERIPANPSVSMNLDCLSTVTTVICDEALARDAVWIDGAPAPDPAARRVSAHLDRIRALAGGRSVPGPRAARVVSENSFPAGAGIASSASAFAALTLAATAALGLSASEDELSELARLGSGSACRSVPAGFVEWGVSGEGASVVRSIAPPAHWRLCDCIAVVSAEQKRVSSRDGHSSAPASPLHQARIAQAARAALACREAILRRDLVALGGIAERDAIMMHAVAMTGVPPAYYWTPATMRVIRAVLRWREEGLPVYFTIDAGPNVHCLCESEHREGLARRLEALEGVRQVLTACPGGGARLVNTHLAA
jgi:diphosphomevalonate decarboxylase